MGCLPTDPRPISICHLMTGYTVHTGSSQKFSQGWDQIFRDQTSKAQTQKKQPPKTQTDKSAKTQAAAKPTKAAKPRQKARKSR